MIVLVRVRHSCRRLVAEVGRDPDQPGTLLVRPRGREIAEVPADWSRPVVWASSSRTSALVDRGLGPLPVPVLCDRCGDARPLLWPDRIEGAVERARARGGPVDLILPE